MKKSFLISILLIGFAIIFSCSKKGGGSGNNGIAKGKMEFRLTDDPYTFAYFKIDFDKLEYNTSDNPAITTGWTEIPLQNRGVIDIIQYSNGRELPLGSLELLPVTVRQLRLKFGTWNSFGINTLPYGGNTSFFEMTLHPSVANGLIIPYNASVQSGVTNRIYFDFDALKSRIQTGNTTFQLLPSVRVFEAPDVSAIEGIVLPMIAHSYVRVVYTNHAKLPDHLDTAYGYPDVTGYYKIIGLDPNRAIPDSVGGLQKVEFLSRNFFQQPPYQPQERQVTLIRNTTVNTGTITLTQ